MHNVLIEVAKGKTHTASSKARDDVTSILESRGFTTQWVHVHDSTAYGDLLKDLASSYRQLKQVLKRVERGSTLIYQYPWDSQALSFARQIRRTARKENLTTIALIHDLNSLRTQSKLGLKYYQILVNEYKFINSFDYVVCHNESMAKHLVQHGITLDKLICLELFDYLLSADQVGSPAQFAHSVSIAGNLSPTKAPYVSLLPSLKNKNYVLDLYGVGYEGPAISGTLEYHGSFDPDELPRHLAQGFGLVWDGNSLDGCFGPLGSYEKYNNPHKLSLYLACGMPVIVWSEAAVADFVRKHEVGIAVSSLRELDDIMKSFTQKEFDCLAQNAYAVGAQATRGEYLVRALEKCVTV